MEVRAEVAQVVEHGTENAGVDSSSLSLGTFLCLRIWEGAKGDPFCQYVLRVGRQIQDEGRLAYAQEASPPVDHLLLCATHVR